MLVFRTNNTATRARKNKGAKSFASLATATKKREQEEAEARAAAQAKAEAEAEATFRASQTKKRGRPSKAQQTALEAGVEAARSSARSSFAAPSVLDKPSTPRSEKTGSVAAEVRRQARAEYRKKIAAMYAKAKGKDKAEMLSQGARDFNIKGASKMGVRELTRLLVQAEVDLKYPAVKKAPKGRASRKGIVPSAATRQKISEKHKAKEGRRAGVGIYRVAVLVNGDFDKNRGADLGPYATARAAAIDAKTLLRTAAKVEDHRISQKMALDMIDEGDESLAQFEEVGLGKVVDGFIVDGAVNGREWEAWVYRVSKRTPATSRALLDNVLPAGDRVQSMSLRANSRRNSTVSFRTRDGRKISFRARK